MDGPVLAIDRPVAKVTPILPPGALQQMIEQTDEKHEEGHHRLRQSIRELEQRFAVLAATQAEMRLALLKAATPDVTSLRLTPSTVLAIIMFVVSLGGGYLTLRDSISELRKGQLLSEMKINELTNKVLDALRQPKGTP